MSNKCNPALLFKVLCEKQERTPAIPFCSLARKSTLHYRTCAGTDETNKGKNFTNQNEIALSVD